MLIYFVRFSFSELCKLLVLLPLDIVNYCIFTYEMVFGYLMFNTFKNENHIDMYTMVLATFHFNAVII